MQFLSADVNTESPFITHGALNLEQLNFVSKETKDSITSTYRKKGDWPQVWDDIPIQGISFGGEHVPPIRHILLT
jgi:hypothetical protein